MELFWSTIALSALIVALILWWDLLGLVKTFRRWKLHRSIPIPKKLKYHLLLGHIPALMNDNESFWKRIEELNEENPGLYKLCIGPFVYLSIFHPKHLPELLKEPKSPDYKLLLPWLGEGLLIAEDKKWFRNRRLLTPAFHYFILKSYSSVYNSCVSVLSGKWQEHAMSGKPVRVFQDISSMSLDIILQCAFSFNSRCQLLEERHPYVEACCQLTQHCTERFLNPFYRYEWIYWRTAHGRKMKKLCKIVHDHAENVIVERRAALASETEKEEKKHYDFLDILLVAKDEEGRGMSDLEIRNEVDTFMFEGHDTTTSGMSWTLYCLAQHPEHQVKIREEVRSVLKDREYLECEDLKHLNYTTWCIKEAMRLYPPVFMFSRITSKDIQLGGYTIPEGTNIDIYTFQIHRNPAVWENSSKFNPVRFKTDNMDKRGPYDYIPFSAGSRNCIGQNFAMNEMKIVIGTLISQFQLEVDTSHSVEIKTSVILKAENDVQLILRTI